MGRRTAPPGTLKRPLTGSRKPCFPHIRTLGFPGDSAVTTWMHRVVVNACLDRLRRRAARPTVPLPEQDTDFGSNMLADPKIRCTHANYASKSNERSPNCR